MRFWPRGSLAFARAPVLGRLWTTIRPTAVPIIPFMGTDNESAHSDWEDIMSITLRYIGDRRAPAGFYYNQVRTRTY